MRAVMDSEPQPEADPSLKAEQLKLPFSMEISHNSFKRTNVEGTATLQGHLLPGLAAPAVPLN